MKDNVGAIILAAGRGKRMQSKSVNKVALSLADKPMILYTVDLLSKLKIKNIIVVVGFAKNSVTQILKRKVVFVEQKKRLGTAHAVSCAVLKVLPEIKNVLVLNGDDSAFYSEQIIKKLIKKHITTNSSFTFLTIEKKDPFGLGRVIRDRNGKVQAVIEEKDATGRQRGVKEVNPGCYVFNVSFLKKYLPKVKKSSITHEYYLTSLIDIGIKNNEKIDTLVTGEFVWQGINTKEELEKAQNLISKI
jgi:bifunctional UDP-N-acetylglucosamine pyrophosphorylase/glucosamine-1-phosphate N-acetyltransferase